MDLRFKLVSSIADSPAVPIAAIAAPEINSSAVSIGPGAVDTFRKLNEESAAYTSTNQVASDPDYYQIPLKSVMPPQAQAYSDSITADILLGPINENMVWEVQRLDGTLIKANNEYLLVTDLRTNQLLPVAMQYSSDGTTWSSNAQLDYVRLIFAAEDLIGAIPMVTFAAITASGTTMYHRLVTPVPRFTDFSIHESIGQSSSSRYSLRFHRSNYQTEFGITTDVIMWQNNPLSNIDIIVPRRRKTQAWTFQIRRATEILGDLFVSTVNLGGARPAVVTAEVPTRVTPGILRVSQRDLNVISSGAIVDLHTDWSVGIHLTINGKDKTSSILDVNEADGYILLKQPVAQSSSVLVDYAVDTTKWAEFNFDMNPRAERNARRPSWMNFDVDDSNYTLYVQRNTMGPDFFIGPSARLNRLYPYPATLENPLGAADFIVKRPEHISLGTLSVRSTKQASIVDIRRPGGGLKKKYQSDTSYDLKSHTDLGFYDGLPIQENAVIIKLPVEVYRSIYDRYLVSDTNTRLDQIDTFGYGSGNIINLSQTPHFSYVLYDWLNAKWDIPQLTVDITPVGGTQVRAIDLTNYTNLIVPPTMQDFADSGQYLFYYFRGAVYLNTSTYSSVTVTYKYVASEVLDQKAHTAASDYIINAIESFIGAGIAYVVQDTDGNPYPIARKSLR